MESVGDSGTYALSLDAEGHVELTHKSVHSTVFGPSFGKYMAGEHDFHHTRKDAHAAYRGRAIEIAGGMDLSFSECDGKPCTLGARCVSSTVEAVTGEAGDGGKKTQRFAVLRCTQMPAMPDALAESHKDGLPFAKPPGLRFGSHEFGFGSRWSELRVDEGH